MQLKEGLDACCVVLACLVECDLLILRCKDQSVSRTVAGYRAECAGADWELPVVGGVCIVSSVLWWSALVCFDFIYIYWL